MGAPRRLARRTELFIEITISERPRPRPPLSPALPGGTRARSRADALVAKPPASSSTGAVTRLSGLLTASSIESNAS